MKRLALAASLLIVLPRAVPAQRDPYRAALDGIGAHGIRAHLEFLSHDLLEGRAPGSRGGQIAALYIADQFARAGLQPVRGTFLQPVPLLGTSLERDRLVLAFRAGTHHVRARFPDDFVVWAGVPDTLVAVDAQLVFVGYGIRAPEYRWDDFKDTDVAGKVLVFLADDPPAPPDEALRFGGRALTYYGRWTYKLEEAGRRGAIGALIVHTPASAGYPWSAVRASWTGERLMLIPGAAPPVPLNGWISHELAGRIFAAAGLSFDELAARATRRDFRPVEMGVHLHARLAARVRRLESANVVGLVPGAHPRHAHEVVIYTAHYDHLGIGTPVDGDSIYNGAYDNASGVATLIELAAAFARLETPPDRSVLFIATAAEEAGLLGAEHYVRHPLFPLAHTRANINIDGANLWGETDDVAAIGAERSTLGRVVELRARELGMRLSPDRSPDKGLFFRADHFPFARAGVPALSLHHGLHYRGRPPAWGTRLLEQFAAQRYHQPSDEFDPASDLAGAVQQARLAFLIGFDVAVGEAVPQWYPNAGSRTTRDLDAGRSQPRR